MHAAALQMESILPTLSDEGASRPSRPPPSSPPPSSSSRRSRSRMRNVDAPAEPTPRPSTSDQGHPETQSGFHWIAGIVRRVAHAELRDRGAPNSDPGRYPSEPWRFAAARTALSHFLDRMTYLARRREPLRTGRESLATKIACGRRVRQAGGTTRSCAPRVGSS